jgi:hypothetical protein
MNRLILKATDRIAILEDINKQTFVRFCEYAYIRDYTPAQQQLVLAASKVDTAKSLVLAGNYAKEYFKFPKKKKKRGVSVFSGFDSVEKSCKQCSCKASIQIL